MLHQVITVLSLLEETQLNSLLLKLALIALNSNNFKFRFDIFLFLKDVEEKKSMKLLVNIHTKEICY